LRGQESAAINSLPDLDHLPESQKQKATGTYNQPVSNQENLLPKSCDKSQLTTTNLDYTMPQSKSDISPVAQENS